MSADHLQLLLGCRPFEVNRDNQRIFLKVAYPIRQFSACSGLSRSLKAYEHEHRGRWAGKLQLFCIVAQDVCKFIPHNFCDMLGRIEAIEHLLIQSFFFNLGLKVFDDFVIHIGFEKGHAQHFQSFGHIALGDLPLTTQELHDFLQSVGQLIEHCILSL